MSMTVAKPAAANLRDYISLARPGYWFKNIFMIPGIVMAYMYYQQEVALNADLFIRIFVGIAATCLVASSNYVINEWLDAEFDRHHPTKRLRASVAKHINPYMVYGLYLMLAGIGLSLALWLSRNFFYVALWLLVMGILYNVKPFRSKDRAYLDVLSESVNNPIRFILGWLIIAPFIFPPVSILLAYWMGGAFLMACKRLAEYRFINDPQTAGLYRKSFETYTENTLLISSFFYALTATFFLGIFLIKHRIELLLTFPLFALMFTWYLRISFRHDSTAASPEKLYKNWKFMIFIALFFCFFLTLLFVRIEWVHFFLQNNFG